MSDPFSQALKRFLGSPATGVIVLQLLTAQAHGAVRFDVPARCGTRADFETSLQARIGEEAAAKLLEELGLVIEEGHERYRLTMQIGAEKRTLEDPSCQDLFRAAVVVAIALWESPKVSPPPEARAPGSAGTLDVATSHTVEASVVPASRARVREGVVVAPRGRVAVEVVPEVHRPIPLLVGVELGIAHGQQPDWSPRLGARVAFESAVFGAATTLSVTLPDTTQDTQARGVTVTTIGGQLAGYWKPVSRIGLEVGLSVHYLHGVGVGSARVWSANVVSLGPHAAIWGIPWESDKIFVAVGVESHLNLVRPQFEISGYGEVYRVPQVSWASYLTAGVRFR